MTILDENFIEPIEEKAIEVAYARFIHACGDGEKLSEIYVSSNERSPEHIDFDRPNSYRFITHIIQDRLYISHLNGNIYHIDFIKDRWIDSIRDATDDEILRTFDESYKTASEYIIRIKAFINNDYSNLPSESFYIDILPLKFSLNNTLLSYTYYVVKPFIKIL